MVKKTIIIALSGILLMAIIGGVSYGVVTYKKSGSENPIETPETPSMKAVKTVCQPTEFKETCEKSLASANTTNPEELIKAELKAAISSIDGAVKSFSQFKEASKDPMISPALDICREVLDTSIGDLKSSINRIGSLDYKKLVVDIADLRTWIGGAVTFHETCLDAFEKTNGDTGEKVRKMLKTSGELLSNGLAMVSSYETVLPNIQIHGLTRRLLQDDIDRFPSIVDATRRRLLGKPKFNAVVAQDGTEQFKTINDALKTVPEHNKEPFVIFIKAGTYEEEVLITKQMSKIVLIGEGPTKTKITGSKNFADGVKTFQTATVGVDGDSFFARDIGFENSAGPKKHQAVALRVTGDDAVFFNCQMDGYQDTLYAHNKRQFYRDCVITGTIDFIFGDAQAIFQNCTFLVRKPMDNQECMVTAQGRKDHNGPGAFIFHNSHILPGHDYQNVKASYLGRPWKEYSRTIIMNSFIDAFIAPEGWSPWTGDFALDTLYYGEFGNKGPGADTAKRVTWKGIQNITPEIADSFTPGKYYQAGDGWIKGASIPYDSA